MDDSPGRLSRRSLLQGIGAATATLSLTPASRAFDDTGGAWWQGDVAHLLPLVDHRQILLKCSFNSAQSGIPHLRVGDRAVAGRRSDSAGRFWRFHVDKLDPGKTYQLQLTDERGKARTDPWPLRTFPAPDAPATHLRILTFTCAGGDEDIATAGGTHFFLALAARQRLLERGLSFSPDVVIANGDHVYWDQATSQNKPEPFARAARDMFARHGELDPTRPALGTPNEGVLTRIVDAQIARLYGVRLRSTPSFFITDDHDLFENDEATDTLVTLPPDQRMLDLARSVQHLYYPEFLPDPTRPGFLPGSGAPDRLADCSEVFGTLRYGRLLEALLYDTKRYSTLKGPQATMIPPAVERWLGARTASTDTAQLLHMPSTPIGWSAGKWGEWYPDVLQADGRLGIERAKDYWPHGWWSQHQRLLAMLHAQSGRPPVIVSGDLHAFSSGQILKSGGLDLANNPVNTLCVGPLGSAGPGFPSFIRGTPPQVPSQLVLDQAFAPLEKNGFSLLDITPEKIDVRMFAWRPPESAEKIGHLQPFHRYSIAR
ncbi:hypothetical protein [Parahaliea mediterranea]|uniref:PhoD-like phosphatase metallophosphatase domain-containing protein n=1 Tax=Parahaliea mediterranea TaxID=651086 RepID=A0A939DGB4_9GAMM|nr:hypothetical protein [Parahaliea mediterranea]MBN7797575.1 hypothetical protein [Parahaliea mediterranea]